MGTAAQPSPTSISIAGNVEGSIVVGDNNFVVNTNHGTIIYKHAAPRVQLRGTVPLPPRNPRGFVGRALELEQLEKWISSSEPAYLHGPEGIGKTTLAARAANGQAAAAAPNGVLFVEGVDEAGQLLGLGDLVQQIFDALFESEPRLKVDLPSARTYLSNTRPFLLLTGASLSVEAFNRLPDLFPAAPILVDTTQPPGGDAYQTLALGPLEAEDALALLADRAGMTAEGPNRPMLAEIAGLLNGVPGALVTVGNAFRGKRLIPAMTAGLLREARTTSTESAQAALERAYRVILPALSQPERGALAQAAASPGLSVDRAWMQESFGDLPVENMEALGLLSSNSPRLRLAPGLRGVALEGQDVDVLREKLYEHLAEQLKLSWLDFSFMNDELGNLLGLLDWSAGTGHPKITRYLTRILDPFLTLHGLWEARGKALELCLVSVRAAQDRAGEAWVLHQLGTQHLASGNVEKARGLFGRARDMRLSVGDSVGAAYSQHNLDQLPPPPPPPQEKPGGGGGLSPWKKGLLIAVLAAGAVLILAIAGSAIARRVRSPATPPPLPTFVRAPTFTARPRPTLTERRVPTLPPSLPPSLEWSIEPEFHDLTDQMVPGCRLSMTIPRVRGATDLRVVGFNAVVDQFMDEEIRRRAAYFSERFGSSCDPADFAAIWSDDYRITSWPAENYMEIAPTLIFGDSATYTSSDILLSVFFSSSYGEGGTANNYSINYDLNRGQPLALSDLFLPNSDYLDYLASLSIEKLISQQESFCAGDPKVFTAPDPENYTTWNLTYFGLRITFNLSDMTPGPCNTAVVVLPYGELAPILDPSGPLGKEIGQ